LISTTARPTNHMKKVLPISWRPARHPISLKPTGSDTSFTAPTVPRTSAGGGRASARSSTSPIRRQEVVAGQVSKAIAMGADGFKNDDAEGGFIGRRGLRRRPGSAAPCATGTRWSTTTLWLEVLEERKGRGLGLCSKRSGTVGFTHAAAVLERRTTTPRFPRTTACPPSVTAGVERRDERHIALG